MYKHGILVVLILFCCAGFLPIVSAQACLPDGITLQTQEDVDNFAAQYPGCKIIEGDLCIGSCQSGGQSAITDLQGLAQLEEVRGTVQILDNANLADLKGLGNVVVIGGSLEIRDNEVLSTLEGLDALQRLKGDLYLRNNCNCLDLSGLNALEVIEGDLVIQFESYTSLSGLEALDTIYGALELRNTSTDLGNLNGLSALEYLGGLNVTNTHLQSLSGLQSLGEIHGNIRISNNYGLFSLAGLNNIHTIHGDLYIGDNDDTRFGALANLVEVKGQLRFYRIWYAEIQDLASLERVGGDFIFDFNNLTYDLIGPENLSYVGGTLQLFDNDNIEDVGGFQSLDTVMGDLEVYNHYNMSRFTGLNNLRHVGGNIEFDGNLRLESIAGFQNLTSVAGEWRVDDNDILETVMMPPGLHQLGGFRLLDNPMLEAIPSLTNITGLSGKFEIFRNDRLLEVSGFENIERVGGDLIIELNQDIHSVDAFHRLEHVGGHLRLANNFSLDTIIGFEEVDSIGGDFIYANSNRIDDLHGFGKLIYVGGDIEMQHVNSFTDLSYFSKFAELNGGLRLSFLNNLKSLAGLEHLSGIGGSFELNRTVNLTSLEGLSNIDTLGGKLSIVHCDSLRTLSGLENLQRINGQLEIAHNDILNDISALSDLDPSSINAMFDWQADLRLIQNDSLSECAIKSICAMLQNPGVKFNINTNGPSCSEVSDLDCSELNLTGTVFYDLNGNKKQDNNEYGISGIGIHISPLDVISLTDERGEYSVYCDSGATYVLTLQTGPDWGLTTDSSSYHHIFEPGNDQRNSSNDFGLAPVTARNGMTVNLSSDATRCNEDVQFYLRVQNTGDFIENTRFRLVLDDLTEFNNASSWPMISGNALRWTVDSLYPYESRDILLDIAMPSEVFTGEELDFGAEVYRDSSGTDVLTAAYDYKPIVLCSYDPNDKLANPPGYKEENYVLKDELITYTVRFQNTGNAPAINVRIIDTIDVNFDMATFEVLNSSFPVQTTVDGRIIEFYFENIWLPDSLSNEPESHGFVTYEVLPTEGLDDFSIVENTAHIIFDFNPPIVTNTTLATLVESICLDVYNNRDTVICEGDSYMGYTQPGVYTDTIEIGSICDSIFTLDLDVIPKDEVPWTYEVCEGDFLTFNGNDYQIHRDTIIYDTIFSSHGCVRVVNILDVDATEMDTISIDTTICEGESYNGLTEEGEYYLDTVDMESGCINVLSVGLTVLPLPDPACVTATSGPEPRDLRIYPNPASKTLFVELSNGMVQSIVFSTAAGRQLLHSDDPQIDLSGISPGMYFVKVKSTTGTIWVKKVLVF